MVSQAIQLLPVLLLVYSVEVAAESSRPVPYQVISPYGFSEGFDNGKTAYHRKKRGDVDRERMVEVVHKDLPSDLPPPTVVAHSPLSVVIEIKADKQGAVKVTLKGEDAIFARIAVDYERDKCLFDPAACEPQQNSQPRREIISP